MERSALQSGRERGEPHGGGGGRERKQRRAGAMEKCRFNLIGLFVSGRSFTLGPSTLPPMPIEEGKGILSHLVYGLQPSCRRG